MRRGVFASWGGARCCGRCRMRPWLLAAHVPRPARPSAARSRWVLVALLSLSFEAAARCPPTGSIVEAFSICIGDRHGSGPTVTCSRLRAEDCIVKCREAFAGCMDCAFRYVANSTSELSQSGTCELVQGAVRCTKVGRQAQEWYASRECTPGELVPADGARSFARAMADAERMSALFVAFMAHRGDATPGDWLQEGHSAVSLLDGALVLATILGLAQLVKRRRWWRPDELSESSDAYPLRRLLEVDESPVRPTPYGRPVAGSRIAAMVEHGQRGRSWGVAGLPGTAGVDAQEEEEEEVRRAGERPGRAATSCPPPSPLGAGCLPSGLEHP